MIVGRRGSRCRPFTTLGARAGRPRGVDVVSIGGLDGTDGRGGRSAQAGASGAAWLCGPRTTGRRSRMVIDLSDRDQGAESAKVEPGSCWAATSWSQVARAVAAKDTGRRESLPAQLVVRSVGRGVPSCRSRPEQDHLASAAGIAGSPTNVVEVDQARADRGDRDQEGRPRHQSTLIRICPATPRRGQCKKLSEDRRPGGRRLTHQPKLVTSAHWRVIDAFEGPPASARASPGQVGQPGRAVADWFRLMATEQHPELRSRRVECGASPPAESPLVRFAARSYQARWSRPTAW